MTTASACRHEVSEQSTLTWTIPVSLLGSEPGYCSCWACGHRFVVVPELRGWCWWLSVAMLSQSELFVSMVAEQQAPRPEPLNCSATASSSSSPAPTSESKVRQGGTSGRADCRPSSPSSAGTTLQGSSISSNPNLAKTWVVDRAAASLLRGGSTDEEDPIAQWVQESQAPSPTNEEAPEGGQLVDDPSWWNAPSRRCE